MTATDTTETQSADVPESTPMPRPQKLSSSSDIALSGPKKKKVAIVTGANTGLGYQASRLFCKNGYHLVLACRNVELAEKAAADLKTEHPESETTIIEVNLASVMSIHQFVEEFHNANLPLHVLVNNAGVGFNFEDPERKMTENDFELTMGTNHLGHFLLTQLLLEDLKETGKEEGDARVIVVTSSIHDWEEANKTSNHGPKDLIALDMDNFMLEKEETYSAAQAYKDSKAASIMFAYEMARRLEGTGVTVNSVCPGFIPRTSFIRHASGASRFYNRYILDGVLRPFKKATRRPEEGGQFIYEIAADPKYKAVTGKYIKEGKEEQSSSETRDSDLQLKVWAVSMKLLELSKTPRTSSSEQQDPDQVALDPADEVIELDPSAAYKPSVDTNENTAD